MLVFSIGSGGLGYSAVLLDCTHVLAYHACYEKPHRVRAGREVQGLSFLGVIGLLLLHG